MLLMIHLRNLLLTTAIGRMMDFMNQPTKTKNYDLYLVAVMLIKIKYLMTW